MPGYHTLKQKRQAKAIAKSYMKRYHVPKKEATRIGWAVTNSLKFKRRRKKSKRKK